MLLPSGPDGALREYQCKATLSNHIGSKNKYLIEIK
jgi:hypothetical protein